MFGHAASPRERSFDPSRTAAGHLHRGGKAVGELLDPRPRLGRDLLDMFERRRVAGENMERLVRKVEVTPSRDLPSIDQDRVQLGQPAGRAGDAFSEDWSDVAVRVMA